MATDMRRLTVSITPDLEPALEKLKKESFHNATQAEMLRFLIQRGLRSVNAVSSNGVF